jgi:aminoglycoside phosphotransferase family enzyme/predicted kinase
VPSGAGDPPPLVIDLCRPENLPGNPRRVEFLFTHGSWVFRTERDVYKIKRPKDHGFFDYSTLEARRRFCERELILNRRTAPDVYLDVVPVRRDARGHSLVRGGTLVDWAVHMRALPDADSALTRLRNGTLTVDDVEAIAARMVAFHREAERHATDPLTLSAAVEENFEQARRHVGRFLDAPLLDAIAVRQRAWLTRHRHRLAGRPSVDGHGDLRLEHVYLTVDGPLFIDCIEFLDRFRIGDPALDMAFLAMDLTREGRPDLSELLMAVVAGLGQDFDWFPLVDGYLAYRAFVRGKVACLVAADADTPEAVGRRKAGQARAFFELSLAFLEPHRPRPTVLAVGGLIGSGKTSLARALVRRLPAACVSADATRKHLAGLPLEQPGPESIYTPAFTARTQAELLRRAEEVLASGRSVILDTTFATRSLRGRAHQLAASRNARFLMLECRAPEPVLRERLAVRTGGLSDAREDLLDRFLASWQPIDELPTSEHLVLDATRPVDGLVEEVVARLR